MDQFSTQAMVRAANLSMEVNTSSQSLRILNNVNLSIATGDTVAINGPSGSGKSTLLGLLAGLDVPTHGRVWLNDQELTALDEDGRARLRAKLVGFVFQSFQLLPNLTAIENVMLPLELAGTAKPRGLAANLLNDVGLEQRHTHYPNQLSGGEQQRVAIARAYVTHPRVLFVDEPTGNLDQRTGDLIIDLLFDLNKTYGTTLVLVTHNASLAQRCSRSMLLEQGCLISDSSIGSTV